MNTDNPMVKNIQLKHILIIDDAPDQRELLKYLLEAKGYTTECTADGNEALVKLKTSDSHPEMILLDLNMPLMGGFDFRRLQLDDPSIQGIPVVIMSGEDDTEATRLITDTEVLRKPLSLSRLLETVERNCSP